MNIFLTSDPGGIRLSESGMLYTPLKEDNNFLNELKRTSNTGKTALLVIAAFPDCFSDNDISLGLFSKALTEAGFELTKADICDYRNPEMVKNISDYNFVILLGGSVPVQNSYFNEIGLATLLKDYDGTIMTISAGTMNFAKSVYALPESSEEANNKNFDRFIPGLGMTDLNIIPHFQYLKNVVFEDGTKVYGDIMVPDSTGRKFICINDGSFIHITESGKRILYGEAYELSNGKLIQICEENKTFEI